MPEPENWQQFRGSELGGLLANIYGTPKVEINYPKLSKKKFEPTAPYTSSGAKVHEPSGRKAVVAVPRVGLVRSNSRPSIAAVDCIARRKQESVIKSELDVIRMRQDHYRPAHKQSIGENEKERLHQICQYKGGKILPEHLSYPISDTPMEIASTKKRLEQNRMVVDRKNPGRAIGPSQTSVSTLSDHEQMKDQVASEINERMTHLDSMRGMGLTAADANRIRSEISQRVCELKKMDKS